MKMKVSYLFKGNSASSEFEDPIVGLYFALDKVKNQDGSKRYIA